MIDGGDPLVEPGRRGGATLPAVSAAQLNPSTSNVFTLASPKCHQIRCECVQFSIAQFHSRHLAIRVSWTSGFRIHRRRFSGVFGTAPEAIVSRLIRCVRSGPKRPSATVPVTVWQLMQAVVSKILPPLGCRVTQLRRLTLLLESSGRTHRASGHRRAAASWRAAFRNTARTVPGRDRSRADRSTCCSDDWESDRSCPPDGEPRSCDRYRPKQREEGRSRVRRVAHRNVQFIGRHDVQLRIAILPPELMPDGDHFNRRCRASQASGRWRSPARSP